MLGPRPGKRLDGGGRDGPPGLPPVTTAGRPTVEGSLDRTKVTLLRRDDGLMQEEGGGS